MSRSLAFILLASSWIMEGQAMAQPTSLDDSPAVRAAPARVVPETATVPAARLDGLQPNLWAALQGRWGALRPAATLPPAIEPANDSAR